MTNGHASMLRSSARFRTRYLTIGLLAGMIVAGLPCLGGIPEPDVILHGRIKLNGSLLMPGRNVRVEARRSSSGTVLAVHDFRSIDLSDCNSNGTRDVCEIDCAGDGGQCNIPGCGAGSDLDQNGILDECYRYVLRIPFEVSIAGQPDNIMSVHVGETVDIVAVDFDHLRCDGGSNDGNPCSDSSQCAGGGSCSVPTVNVMGQFVASTSGAIQVLNLGGACTMNAINPPTCSIDARQPHALNDPNQREGWSSVQLSINCGLAAIPDHVFATSSPSGSAPSILSTTVQGQDISIVLTEPIPAGHWTCIDHVSTANRVCLGALPADVNGDGSSSVADIGVLLDVLRGKAMPPPHSADLDRSGSIGPPDLLRAIDLLRGGGTFQPWLGSTLVPCPSQ